MNILGMGGRLTAVMDERAIFDQPAGRGEPLHFRYIAMHGTGCDERLAWVDQLAASHERLDFGSNPDILTSRAGRAFDFVVFGGEDAPRLARFVRDHGAMWHDEPNCASVCAVNQNSAQTADGGFRRRGRHATDRVDRVPGPRTSDPATRRWSACGAATGGHCVGAAG